MGDVLPPKLRHAVVAVGRVRVTVGGYAFQYAYRCTTGVAPFTSFKSAISVVVWKSGPYKAVLAILTRMRGGGATDHQHSGLDIV